MNFLSEYQKILLNSTSEKCCCRSVICLGINDAGRCCLMKQQLSSLTALVASNLHISFTNTGHLAISAVMECKKGGKKSRAEMYFRFGRSVNCIADLHLDFSKISTAVAVISPLWCVQTSYVAEIFEFIIFFIDFSYLSVQSSRGSDELQERRGIKMKWLWMDCHGSLRISPSNLLLFQTDDTANREWLL